MGVRRRVVSKRVVLADVPWTPKIGKRDKKRNDGPPKPEPGYKNRNDGIKKWNQGTFAKTALHLSPLDFGASKAVLTKARLLKHHLPVHGQTSRGRGQDRLSNAPFWTMTSLNDAFYEEPGSTPTPTTDDFPSDFGWGK